MVKKSKLNVVWNRSAYTALQLAFDYIREESPANAEKVREGILKVVRDLADHPGKFPPDKLKKNNVGDYRAFEKYSYRIAYKVEEKQIIILRIRHVKQEPQAY